MSLRYIGLNTNVETSWATAYFYDENFAPVAPLPKTVVSPSTIFDYEIEADGYVKFVYDHSADFKVMLANVVEYETVIPVSGADEEKIVLHDADLNEIGAIDFSGNEIVDSNYKRAGLRRIKANTMYGFRGFLNSGRAIAVYDCNGRFLESYLGYQNQTVPTKAGTFTTPNEAFYIRVCTNVNSIGESRWFPFEIWEIEEEIKPASTAMTGIKRGGNFVLCNGKQFTQTNTGDTWEEIIAILSPSTKQISNNYVIDGASLPKTLKPPVEIIDFMYSGSRIYFNSIGKSGIWATNGNNIYLSRDGGSSFELIDTVTKYDGNNVVHIREDIHGSLYITLRLPGYLFPSLGIEEELIKYTKTDSGWSSDYTAKLSVTHSTVTNAYATIALKWGFTVHDNIVVVNDYGMQGIAGRVWLSADYGESFTKIFDIYEAPFSEIVRNGHVHGSCYDAVYNRIWVTTGDGYTNTYIFYSDDLGINWKHFQVKFKSTITGELKHIQHTKVLSFSDCVLFLDDSPYAGAWRYNRGGMDETPIVEWACDVTDHSLNQMANADTQMAGLTLERYSRNAPVVMGHSWHDADKGNAGVVGNIAVSMDNYNWFVIYKDVIDTSTGRGYISPNSVVFSDENFIYCSTESGRVIKIDIRDLF